MLGKIEILTQSEWSLLSSRAIESKGRHSSVVPHCTMVPNDRDTMLMVHWVKRRSQSDQRGSLVEDIDFEHRQWWLVTHQPASAAARHVLDVIEDWKQARTFWKKVEHVLTGIPDGLLFRTLREAGDRLPDELRDDEVAILFSNLDGNEALAVHHAALDSQNLLHAMAAKIAAHHLHQAELLRQEREETRRLIEIRRAEQVSNQINSILNHSNVDWIP